MKTRHMLMGAGLVAALWITIYGDATPDGELAEASERNDKEAGSSLAPTSAAPPTSGRRTRPPKVGTVIDALQPRDSLFGENAQVGGENTLFASQTWAVPPPPPPRPDKAVETGRATAPVLPFIYIGKKSEDGVWEVFLARGEQTFIVKEQMIIDGAYRVDAITPSVLSLTYLPLGTAHAIGIGGTD